MARPSGTPKGRRGACALLVLCAIFASLEAPASASPPSPNGTHKPAAVPGEVLVRYATGLSAKAHEDVRARAGVTAKRNLLLPGLQLVRALPGTPIASALSELNSDPRVLYAEPNWLYELQTTPDDPMFGQQWALRNTGQAVDGIAGLAGADISAPIAWGTSTGSRSVKVAVIDTGINHTHPELAANMWRNPGEAGTGDERNGVDDDNNGFVDDLYGWNFIHNNSHPDDSNGTGTYDGHGTAVAGIIGAVGDNDIGVAGINWNVSLIALKACQLPGVTNGCPLSAVLDAMTYAGRAGADVVNLSLSGSGSGESWRDVVASIPNTLFVAAAGNDGANNDTDPIYPCSLDLANLVCVAATDQQDQLISQPSHFWASNYGATSVDLGAPGTNNLTTSFYEREFFNDTFESPTPLWDYTDGPDDPTRWRRTGVPYGNSVGLIIEDSDGSYPNNADTRVTLNDPINLSRQRGCSVVVHAGLDTEVAKDYLRLEAATNRAGPYTELARWSGSTQGAFADFRAGLGALDGARLYLRLRVTSDAQNTGDGAHVGVVSVQCSYTLFAGTSSATPHVAGAAALLKSHLAPLSVAQLRERLLRTVDPLPSLAGKTGTGGRLNVERALTADLDAPTAAISSGPAQLSGSSSASFGFSASEAGAAFECRLDGATFAACNSPKQYGGLADGQHSFAVRAKDAAGNVGAPAEATWTIDTAGPVVSITDGPSGSTTSRAASFAFAVSEPAAASECSVDGGAFAACGSPASYDGLAVGTHSFAVRARDAAGNWTAAPATRTWTITEATAVVVGGGGGVVPRAPSVTEPQPLALDAPRVALGIPRQTLRRALRYGLVSFASARALCPCRLTQVLRLDAALARRIGLVAQRSASRSPSVARSTSTLAVARRVRALLRLSPRARARLARVAGLQGWVDAKLTDRYGRSTTARHRVRLRR